MSHVALQKPWTNIHDRSGQYACKDVYIHTTAASSLLVEVRVNLYVPNNTGILLVDLHYLY